MTRRERWIFYGLIGIVIISSLFQTIGVGAIFPFLLLLLDPVKVESNAHLASVREHLGIEEGTEFAMAMGVVAISLFLLGLVFKFVTEYALVRYALGRQFRFSLLILEEKLNMPYEEYININSAETITQVTNHVVVFVNSFFLPLLRIISDSVLFLFLIALLVATSPIVALTLALFIGGGYGIFYSLTARKIQDAGAIKREATIRQTSIANECMAGFKEMKVLGRISDSLNKFEFVAERIFSSGMKYNVLHLTPPIVLQAVVIVVLFSMILFFIRGGDARGVVALMGFIGVAAKQLMPALTSVFSSLQSVRYTMPLASDLSEILIRIQERNKTHINVDSNGKGLERLVFEREIVLDNLSFGYAGAKGNVLNDINLTIPKNSSIALVGSSGAGKTTFVDLLIGLFDPDSGSIRVDGENLCGELIGRWQKMIGYVPQSIFLADTTVRENIAFGLPEKEIDDEAVLKAARAAQIHDFIIDELPQRYRTLVGERGVRLSGGQRQRLGIARALYHQPDVIVLDEATSALDNRTEREITKAIEGLGGEHTLVIIAHRLTTVEKCDQIILLSEGRIRSQGTYKELVSDCPEFQKLAFV